MHILRGLQSLLCDHTDSVPYRTQGAQSNLNDLKGNQPHETQAPGVHPAPATPNPPPSIQTEAAPSKDQQAADLNKVKDGLSKVSYSPLLVQRPGPRSGNRLR